MNGKYFLIFALCVNIFPPFIDCAIKERCKTVTKSHLGKPRTDFSSQFKPPPGFERGHIIASSLGGGNDYDNLVWMTKAANIGNFGKTEGIVRQLLNNGTCSSVHYCVKFDDSSFYNSIDIEEITTSENIEDGNDEEYAAPYAFGLGRIIGKIGKIGKPRPGSGSGKENKKPGTEMKRCSMIWKSKTICAPKKFEQTYECRKGGNISLFKGRAVTFN